MFAGYRNDPAATAAAFAPGGWFRTGDLATVGACGYLSVVDRRTDMVLHGGEKVYCTEVEAVLVAHPAVGMPSPLATLLTILLYLPTYSTGVCTSVCKRARATQWQSSRCLAMPQQKHASTDAQHISCAPYVRTQL